MLPVLEAAYRQAGLQDIGISNAAGSRWNPLGTARAGLPAVANAPALFKPAVPAVSLTGLYDGWTAVAVVKPRTVAETKYIVDQLAEFTGHDDAAKITRDTLIGWRDALKADGKTNNTWNNRLSLVRVREKVGITDPAKAPDHSWRHRVEDELRAAGVGEDGRDAILGHARKTTGRLYGVRGEALGRLKAFVESLPVPGGINARSLAHNFPLQPFWDQDCLRNV